MRLWIVLAGFFVSGVAYSSSSITCTHYVVMGVEFAKVRINIQDDGHVEPFGQVTHYGMTKQTAIVEHEPDADQLYNLTIEADLPGQELELLIFKPASDGATISAKLINPQSPAMREMPGQCEPM